MITWWLWLMACDRGTAPAEAAIAEPMAVTTAPVQAARYRPATEITGSAEPIRSVQLGFDVPGRLQKLLVQRGERVVAGQELAVLDGSVAYSQYNQAKAGVAAAEAGAAAAQDGLDRVLKLGNLATPAQIAQAEGQAKAAAAQADQARAGERAASTSLWLHTLRSPIDGVVTNGPDNPGTLVGAGTPLFVIEDLSALRVKGSAPEVDGWVTSGLAATVRSGTGPQTAQGVVERVLPSLDPATRRVPVEIRIDSPPEWLRAHAFVRVEVTAASDMDALSIPKGALVARPDFAVLKVPGPTAAPVRVPVSVVGEDDDRTLVLGDLAVGDAVAVDPPQGFGE
ncbi:MAG: efflux RND transporter periplasmic adaptor subunit [Myxococcota bacterium]